MEGGEAQPWDAPQTRVSETGDGTGSKWDGNEEIDVQIEGSTETATYIVQANGTVSSDAPLYWSDRNTHTVTAWYSATDGTLDLSDHYRRHTRSQRPNQRPCLPAARHGYRQL